MTNNYLLSLTTQELESKLQDLSLPKFRSKQIIKWVYEKKVETFEEMSDISKKDQGKLAQALTINTITPLEQHTSKIDKTQKILFETEDHQTFETVLMLNNGRNTLCISSQIGCKMACSFCATGLAGFERNLNTSEIVEQFLFFSRSVPIHNVVFMGMGEPLDNYDNLLKAIRILNEQADFGQRRMTTATACLIRQ